MPGLGDAFVGGFSPEDWMLGGQAPPQNPPDQPWGPSWLQKAQAQTDQDIAAYQKGGIPALLAGATDPARQDLMSGFGGPAVVGRTKAVGGVAKAAAEAAAPAAQDVSLAAPYVQNPQRVFNPGIYKDPRIIAAEANAQLAPEHPALKQLFGVTREDLYDISQQGRRVGNQEPIIPTVANPRGSATAEAIMTPANAQRLVDIGAEATKYPGLIHGMDPWYVMDPAYQRMARLVGPEQAAKDYLKFNVTTSMFSPASDVMTEINRGTGAHMMATQGRWPEFMKYGGVAEAKRGPDFPPELRDVVAHPYHSTSQAGPAGRYLETGKVDMTQPKVPLYMQASGVPETGFQTRLPVPDAHFTRGVGMADVRQSAKPGVSMKTPEYAQVGPWFREQVAKPLGIEAVPAQARQWGVLGPQTGVDTKVGAGKLELLSQSIWERAHQLGIDPAKLRDDVLMGKAHALWLLGIPAAGLGAQLGGAAVENQYQ